MPPVENSTPAQPPKKPGLFARLFGKKKDKVEPPTTPVSQTPPPQLNDTPPPPAPVASVGNDIVSATPVSSTMPAMPVQNNVSSGEAVEPAVAALNDASAGVPPVSATMPAEGDSSMAESPSVPPEGTVGVPDVSTDLSGQPEQPPHDQDKPLTPQNPFA